jgi:hypothetical protein
LHFLGFLWPNRDFSTGIANPNKKTCSSLNLRSGLQAEGPKPEQHPLRRLGRCVRMESSSRAGKRRGNPENMRTLFNPNATRRRTRLSPNHVGLFDKISVARLSGFGNNTRAARCPKKRAHPFRPSWPQLILTGNLETDRDQTGGHLYRSGA